MGDPPDLNERRHWVRVLAIDAAPGKPSTVFDGTDFLRLRGCALHAYLNDPVNRTPETLVCWDAPLTGPANPASAGKRPADFTQRLIEKFFSRAATGFRTPPGISVRPYCGCPHWTISRSLLGLPIVGPHDEHYRQLPFHLLPGPDRECAGRPSIIEIHPGVAAWLWCRNDWDGPWNYKQDNEIRNEMWRILRLRTQFPWTNRPAPQDDDEFDAAVGFILGSLYAGERTKARYTSREVTLLGNRSTGSFLLPAVPRLTQSWNAWTRR